MFERVALHDGLLEHNTPRIHSESESRLSRQSWIARPIVFFAIFAMGCVPEMTPAIRARIEREGKLRKFALELASRESNHENILEAAREMAQKNQVVLSLVDASSARLELNECIVLFEAFDEAGDQRTPLLIEIFQTSARSMTIYVFFSNGDFATRSVTNGELKELMSDLTPASARQWYTDLEYRRIGSGEPRGK